PLVPRCHVFLRCGPTASAGLRHHLHLRWVPSCLMGPCRGRRSRRTAAMTTIPVNLPAAEVITAFHRLYYHSLGWDRNFYLGYQIKQAPFDLQVYHELVV